METEINLNKDCYFFWSGFCSNWFPAKLEYKGKQFFNSEQAFMWEKAKFFGDDEMAEKILKINDPSEAKKLGRKVKNFDADKWATVSYQFMVDVNVAKFEQNFELKEMLIGTGNLILVEASPYDKIWSIGLGEVEAKHTPKENWNGTNWLGKALMDVRKLFIENETTN